jgi:hypothetical protein
MKQTVIRRVIEGGPGRKAPGKPQPKSNLKSQLKSKRNPKLKGLRKTRSANANTDAGVSVSYKVRESQFARQYARLISQFNIAKQASSA